MKTTPRRILTGILFAVIASVAFAHPGHDGHELTWDFAAGFAHPFTGWDHILAMVAVGWWAMLLGGRVRWAVVAAFLSLLAVGSLVRAVPIPMSFVEQAVAASVVVMGLLVATAARMPEWPAAALVGAFAVFHGVAHGAAMATSVNGLEYRLGFVTASAALIGCGMAIAVVARRTRHNPERIAGMATALAGLLLLVR